MSKLLLEGLAVFFAGMWAGVGCYEMYLRRLHRMNQYIRRVQQGERRKRVSRLCLS